MCIRDRQCLEFCIWRCVEWVTDTCYQEMRKLAVSEWLIESRLRGLLRRIASVTPLDGEWLHSWHALQTETREMLESCDPSPSGAVREYAFSQDEIAIRRSAGRGAGFTPTGGDPDAEEFQRARLEGMAWARAYATADEVRNLVQSGDAAQDGDLALDNLHWRGFLDGAEAVLDAELGG